MARGRSRRRTEDGSGNRTLKREGAAPSPQGPQGLFRVLALETATMMMGAAVLDQTGLLAEYRLLASRSRSERLMPLVERMMADIQCAPGDLNGIAVSIGPGSFTGLRVGVSMAKGLSFSLGIPVIGVSTLESLAAPLAQARCPFLICPVLDAKRGEVYAALFRNDREKGMVRLLEDRVLTPGKVCEELARLGESALLVGTGAEVYGTFFQARLGERAVWVPQIDPHPSAAVVARVGRSRLMAGERSASDSDLVPVYLSRFEPKTAPGGRRVPE